MLTLGIETTARQCGAATFDAASRTVAAEVSRDAGRGHSETIMDTIAATLARTGASYRDLRRIAVATGPGSFTGIRAGVAAARGLALALGVPAVGVGVLEALAAEAREGPAGRKDLAAFAAIAARDGLVFFQGFDAAGEAIATPACDSAARAAEFLATRMPRDAFVCGEAGDRVLSAGAFVRPVVHRLPAPPALRIAAIGAAADPARRLPSPAYVNPPGAKPQPPHGA